MDKFVSEHINSMAIFSMTILTANLWPIVVSRLSPIGRSLPWQRLIYRPCHRIWAMFPTVTPPICDIPSSPVAAIPIVTFHGTLS